VYTSDFDARNAFRSTASHNTLQIDGQEQNDLKPDWIFRLFETSHAEHVSFRETPHFVEYTGRHHGYERFDPPVTHERTMRLSKTDGSLAIADQLTGRGEHTLCWHFQLAPGVAASVASATAIRLSNQERHWTMTIPDGLRVSILPSLYSPSYGVVTTCVAVDLTTRATLNGSRRWDFAILP
jgi:hypothetical protein